MEPENSFNQVKEFATFAASLTLTNKTAAMINFNDLSKGKRYTLPHIKAHYGYHLKLESVDEQVRNNGTNDYYKSATFRASGGSQQIMDLVGSHVFNVTFWEDGNQFVSDTLLTEE